MRIWTACRASGFWRKPAAKPVVPEWPQFLEGCILYRRSLDKQAPEAPRTEERCKDR